MFKKLQGLWADKSGVTMVEYGFIAASVGLGITTGVFIFGEQINDMLHVFSGFLDTTPMS